MSSQRLCYTRACTLASTQWTSHLRLLGHCVATSCPRIVFMRWRVSEICLSSSALPTVAGVEGIEAAGATLRRAPPRTREVGRGAVGTRGMGAAALFPGAYADRRLWPGLAAPGRSRRLSALAPPTPAGLPLLAWRACCCVSRRCVCVKTSIVSVRSGGGGDHVPASALLAPAPCAAPSSSPSMRPCRACTSTSTSQRRPPGTTR